MALVHCPLDQAESVAAAHGDPDDSLHDPCPLPQLLQTMKTDRWNASQWVQMHVCAPLVAVEQIQW